MSIFDEQAQQQRELQLLEAQAAQDAADFKLIASDEAGRRFLARLLAQCGTGKSPFDKEPFVMAKNIGRQEVGLYIYGLFNLGGLSDLHKLMQDESKAWADNFRKQRLNHVDYGN